MAPIENEVEAIARKPEPFCVVRKADPIEKQRKWQREWLANVTRYLLFWQDFKNGDYSDGRAAVLRYWCGGCGKMHNHDVAAGGPIATCPNCGNRVDLRPEGEFGGNA